MLNARREQPTLLPPPSNPSAPPPHPRRGKRRLRNARERVAGRAMPLMPNSASAPSPPPRRAMPMSDKLDLVSGRPIMMTANTCLHVRLFHSHVDFRDLWAEEYVDPFATADAAAQLFIDQ